MNILRDKIPRTIESFVSRWSSINPQASDDAKFGLWGYLGAVSLYIWYAVVTNKKQDIEPQAEEITQSEGMPMMKQQNVMYADTHPGYITDVKGETDELRQAPFTDDATLQEFFSRPIKVISANWNVNTDFFLTFNPWSLYFENPRVINRISNYKLMTSDLHVKITINGNAFHYGRLIAAYNPLPTTDTLTLFRQPFFADYTAASQRPHIYLDPTNSQGGELKLPFFYYKNCLDIVGQDWRDLGDMVIANFSPLKHANGATDAVTVNVFVWAENVTFSIPTQIEPGSIVPQADEYGQGILSKPATAVAKVANALGKVPLLSPYARATEIGAKAFAQIASMFGYCRPVDLKPMRVRLQQKNDLAICNGEDDTMKLSVDAKQELTLDPRTVGLSSVDELSIPYIAQRESWLTIFPWTVGRAREEHLFSTLVDPCIHRNLPIATGLNERNLPATAFASIPFNKWRGSMKFRFQVICSKYHKGRLKVVYDPSGNPLGNAEYNTAYTTIVDISDNTDFTITCGWGQSTTYRKHCGLSLPQIEMFSRDPLTYLSHIQDFANGTLSVYVVNELTVPNSTVNNDIDINVFVSAGEDFELAEPTYNYLSLVRYTDLSALTNLSAEDEAELMEDQALLEDVEPQAEEAVNNGDETDRMDSAPMGAPVMDQMANVLPKMDNTNLVHFGESIRSFRTLLKRYTAHEVIGPQNVSLGNGTLAVTSHIRPTMPFEPGFTNNPGFVTRPAQVAGQTGQYYFSQMPLIRYISTAYGGWRGGIRWMADTGTALSPNGNLRGNSVNINRVQEPTEPISLTFTYNNLDFDATNGLQLANNFLQGSRANNGTSLSSLMVNPSVTAELPYYSEYRFTPAKQKARFDEPLFNNPSFGITLSGNQSSQSYCTTYCAAAEDFSCFFFLGAPRIFTQASYPGPVT